MSGWILPGSEIDPDVGAKEGPVKRPGQQVQGHRLVELDFDRRHDSHSKATAVHFAVAGGEDSSDSPRNLAGSRHHSDAWALNERNRIHAKQSCLVLMLTAYLNGMSTH